MRKLAEILDSYYSLVHLETFDSEVERKSITGNLLGEAKLHIYSLFTAAQYVYCY